MQCLRVSSLFLLSVLLAPAQDVKEFEKRITEFTLPNGLHFILLERHEAPVISFHTMVHAGAIDAPLGQTGLAKLLDRMAYKGTETIGTNSWPAEKKAIDAVEEIYDRMEAEINKGPKADLNRVEVLRNQAHLASETADRAGQPGDYLKILEENGAQDRLSFGSLDRITFSYSLLSNRLELWFLMESQRLMRPVFREFYKERDAQLAEYRQQWETSPQIKVFGEFLATAFKEHPYRNPVSGWPSDLRNLRRTAAREFFDRYFVPGNITISIVGDVNPAEARRLAERYFGPMPARPLPPAPRNEEPPQEGPKTVVVETAGGPMLLVGYKRPNQYDKDDLVFDVIQALLSSGANSGILTKDLVDERHCAVQARAIATFPSGVGPNLVTFFVQPAQGHTIEENQRALDDVLQRFKANPVDAVFLTRAKAFLRASFMQRLTQNTGAAELLSEFQAEYGDWRKMFRSFDEIDKITAEMVQRVAERYLVATGRTTAYNVPAGQSGVPAAPRPGAQAPKTGGLQ